MVETAPWLAVTEAAYRAFDEAVRRDIPELDARYEALFLQDPEDFRRVFDQAARCGDVKTLEVLGGVLERHGAQDWRTLTEYASALLYQAQYAAAAEVFDRIKVLRSARVAYGRARALAGAGRLGEAVEAAEEALQARPGHPLCEVLRGRLMAMAPLRAREAELRGWSELEPLLTGYLALGLEAEAAALLRRVMREPGSVQLSIAAQLAIAELALRVCAPEEVSTYIAGIRPKYPDRLAAARIGVDVLTGGAASHCAAESPASTDKGLRFWSALACESAGSLPNAIRQLSSLAEAHSRDPEIRSALARSVGRAVIEATKPRFAPGGSGKIVNLVVFNNEFALLRMHLEEMSPFVDRFVIVEAGQTFMGGDKPLHFQENRDQFADFSDRIVHLAVPRFPEFAATAWARDFYQRDYAIAAAQHLCGQDDFILATDTDEIINSKALEGFVGDYACLQLAVSRFFLNYRMTPGAPKATRPASVIVKARHLMEHGLSYVRFYLARRSSSANAIQDAGWHFTSVNDPDRIALKLGSYAHQEQTKTQFKTPAHIRQVLERIRAGELEPGWERAKLDDRLPGYIQRNRAALAGLLL